MSNDNLMIGGGIFLILFSWMQIALAYVFYKTTSIIKARQEQVRLVCELKTQTPLGFIYYGDLMHHTPKDFLNADCSIRNAKSGHEMVVQETIKQVLSFLNLPEKEPSKVSLDDLGVTLYLALMLYRKVKHRSC